MRNLRWKRFSAVPESNNSHITTGNDTTSTQLLGIRPTLISYICVVTLKNKQQQQQKKQYDWWNVTSGPAFCLVYWCCLSHDFCSYFKSHPREIKLLNLWNLFVCIQSRKCLLNPHKAFLSACPPTLFLSSSQCTCLVCLFLLCLTLPDGFSVSGLGDWFQLWAAGRRAACTLMCSRNCTLWRITGLLIHSRDRVSKTWEEWKKPYWNCNARTGEKSKKRGKRKQVNM